MYGDSINNRVIENPYGYIYCTTNLVNGTKYIGQHRCSAKNQDTYIGSGRNIKKAIKEFGKNNFSKEILCWATDQRELDQLEIDAINSVDAVNSNNYYNIAPGGFTHEQSLLTREKISKTLTGIKRSDETKRKMSECKKRENLSEETRQKLKEKATGRKMSPESIEKMRQKKIGQPVSDETRRKISEANKGRKVSDETRENMRKAQKGHPKYPGTGIAPIRVRCIETGEEFDSLSEAGRKTGIDFKSISAYLKGKIKSAKGYHFEKI